MLFRAFIVTLFLAGAGSNVDARNDDPLEPINRPLFVVNDVIDRTVLKPVARSYERVVPQPAKSGVSNFFANLMDVTRSLNSLLQWRLGEAGTNVSRVALNSTLGMFGLFDVASDMGIERERTDFGQTLAVWGVPEGPYIMVPLIGPRTLRSGTGTVFDTLASPTAQVDQVAVRNSMFFLELISFRARLLESDQLISGDRYIFVRDAYLQQRRSFISGGEIQDDFSDYEDDWAEEF